MISLPVLLVLKVFVYFGVAALGAWRWRVTGSSKWVRVLLGGFARFALGWIVGIPAGVLLRGSFSWGSEALFYAAFFALRFLLWLLVLRIAFRQAPMREVVGLSVAGALANAALDLALDKPVFDMFYFNMC